MRVYLYRLLASLVDLCGRTGMEGTSTAALPSIAGKLVLLMTCFSPFIVLASPPPAATMIPSADRREIERQLTEEVQHRVNEQKRIEGQSKKVDVLVRFDLSSKRVIVSLSRGYVPKYAGGQLEDLEAELRTVVEELLMGLVDFSGVTFHYDGRSIQYFHPDPPKPAMRGQFVPQPLGRPD